MTQRPFGRAWMVYTDRASVDVHGAVGAAYKRHEGALVGVLRRLPLVDIHAQAGLLVGIEESVAHLADAAHHFVRLLGEPGPLLYAEVGDDDLNGGARRLGDRTDVR